MGLLIIHLLAIGLLGAILFLTIDKFEGDRPLATLLKFLVLVFGGVAILHKVLPLFGIVF